MADPGWYKDRTDRSLARWFDGSVWTEHTLVIADQPDGVMPPPPDGPSRPPEPEPAPEPERQPEPEQEPESAAEPEPEPAAEPPPAPTPDPATWAPPTRAPEPVPTLSLGGPVPSSATAEPARLPIVPKREPDPVVPVPAPSPADHAPEPGSERASEPEPGPASHLEELPPQGTELRVPASASERSEPVPSLVGGRTFEPPSFEGPPPNRLAALPPWARVAVPVLVLLVVLVAAVLLLGGNGEDGGPATVAEAASIAEAELDTDLPTAKVESMVEQLCGAAETGSSTAAVILAKQLPVRNKVELRSTLIALGVGARARCPEAEVEWPAMLDDIFLAAAVDFAP